MIKAKIKKLSEKISQYIKGENEWTTLGNNVQYARRGGFVFVRFYNGGSIALTKAGTSLGTMPEGYRPFSQIDFAGTALGGAESVFFRIAAGGSITGFASASTTYWSGLICYPAKIVGGGVLRNLSIFKAFRHFMLLQKGGGIDGQNGIEGTAEFDSRKNQGSSENSAVFEPADNLEHYGKSVSDVAEERSTGWIQTDSVSLCMLRNGRNYYIPVRSLHRRKHYLTRTALARNSRISNSKHNERNGSLHKERVSIIDPLISGRRWAA